MNEPEWRYHQDRAFIAYCRRASLPELRAAYADELASNDLHKDWKLCALERAIRQRNEKDPATPQDSAPAHQDARQAAKNKARKARRKP